MRNSFNYDEPFYLSLTKKEETGKEEKKWNKGRYIFRTIFAVFLRYIRHLVLS